MQLPCGDERLEVEEERDERVELGDIGVTGAAKGRKEDMIDGGVTGGFHTNGSGAQLSSYGIRREFRSAAGGGVDWITLRCSER